MARVRPMSERRRYAAAKQAQRLRIFEREGLSEKGQQHLHGDPLIGEKRQEAIAKLGLAPGTYILEGTIKRQIEAITKDGRLKCHYYTPFICPITVKLQEQPTASV